MKTGDPLARVLRLSRSVEPSAAATRRVRAAAELQWRAAVQRRRSRSWALMVAASALAAAGAMAFFLRSERDLPVGVLQASHGGVVVTTPTRGPLEGGALPGGTLIETDDDGGAHVALEDGGAIRLDARSRLRLDSAARLTLEAGALYFDSGAAVVGAGPRVEVHTPLARLWNLGTRYELRLEGERLEIAVRSGRVGLERASGGSHTLDTGELLVLATGDSVVRREVLPSDTRYGWTQRLGPPFAVEGRRLGEFLHWVERESGLEVRLLTEPDLRNAVLRGDLVWREPLPAIEPTLRLVGLQAEIRGDALFVTD